MIKRKRKKIPSIGKPEFRVLFYHDEGPILKYLFMNEDTAHAFYESLDYDRNKPTIYRVERIR